MNEHVSESQIDAWVENLLEARERAQVDAHLAGCARCRAEADAMRSLLDAMRGLPRDIDPGVDLRPAIHAARAARTHADARRSWARSLRVPLAAAAVLLVAVTAGVTALVLSDRAPAVEVARSRPGPVDLVSFDATRADHVRTAGELAVLLERHREELSPETVALVEENLRIIDRALREAEAALRADSAAPGVRDLILATHERKVEVLRWANDLTRG
jgi:anti-sigma factor RsiW